MYKTKNSLNDINYLKYPIMASFISVLYFFLIKEYTHSKKSQILSIVILLQLLIIYLYYQSLKNIKSGIIYAFINGLSVILGAVVANVYFRESFTRNDIIGILLIIIGIIIVGK